MKKVIAFDLSSGDSGSLEALSAAINFAKLNKDWKILAYSIDEENITSKKIPSNIELIICKEIIEQADGVLEVRRKNDATLVKAIEAVKNGNAEGVISTAGSGPLVTAGFLNFRGINGSKPAFAPLVSSVDGQSRVILDVGANIGANAEQLNQYAIMGSVFIKALNINDNPIVMQLNIGSEDKKGTDLQQETFKLLKDNDQINFKGNIEANEILSRSDVHVILTEAYSGNIALKSYEGAIEQFKKTIKDSMSESFLSKIGFVLASRFRKKMKLATNDELGGAIVLGLNNLLIKAHGRSDAKLLFNSLMAAKKLIESDLINNIKKAI